MHEPSLCLFLFFFFLATPRLQPKHQGIQQHPRLRAQARDPRAGEGVPAYRLPLSGCPAVRGARGEVTVPLQGWPAGRVTLGLLGCRGAAAVALHGAALDAPAAGHGALREGTQGECGSHHTRHAGGSVSADSDALSNFQVRLFIVARKKTVNLKPVGIFAVGFSGVRRSWTGFLLKNLFLLQNSGTAKPP